MLRHHFLGFIPFYEFWEFMGPGDLPHRLFIICDITVKFHTFSRKENPN